MTDRISLKPDNTLDEICAGFAHLEQMDFNHWYIGMGRENGSHVQVWLRAKGKITATFMDNPADGAKFEMISRAECDRLIAEAVQAERERCAGIADSHADARFEEWERMPATHGRRDATFERGRECCKLAGAIRAVADPPNQAQEGGNGGDA